MQVAQSKYFTKLDRNNTSFTLRLFEYFKKAKWDHTYDFLKYYQNIVREYINDVQIDSRGLLVYHGMGLGKSILAVAVAMDLLKERQPIILLTKSLQGNMRGAIYKYVKLRKEHDPDYHLGKMSQLELDDWIERNYSFVSMNASNMLKQMNKAAEGHSVDEFDAALERKFGEVLKLTSLDGKLLIVDEAHNLFRAITNGGKNAQGLYDMVMKAKNLKILFLTGTPVANDPFEMVPCFNMIGSRSNMMILPDSYKEFNKLFVDSTNGNIKNKEKFQNRLLGLVSFVTNTSQPGKALDVNDAATRAEFPEEKPIVVERVHMDDFQYVAYQLARDKEKEEGNTGKGPIRIAETPSMTKPKSRAASTYKVKSRQLSNYCAPPQYRDEKDPHKIPAEYTESAKYRRMHANIERHRGQLGIVYSQFVGTGGLGTFARYLESKGWERVLLTAPARGARASHQTHDIPASEAVIADRGESGAAVDNRTESDVPEGDVPEGDLSESEVAEGGGFSIQDALTAETFVGAGPGLPSAEDYIREIEEELKASAGYVDGGMDGGMDGGVEDGMDGGVEDGMDNRVEGGVEDEPENMLADESICLLTDRADGADKVDSADGAPVIRSAGDSYAFRYAQEGDVGIIRKINPKFQILKQEEPVLIVFKNDRPIGYILVSFSADASDVAFSCSGRVIEVFIEEIIPSVTRNILEKIVEDIIQHCKVARVVKTAGGDTIDATGARPEARPGQHRRFAVISGEVAVEDRTRIQDMFNDPNNKHGGAIDLILLSSTGAEGLDLKNVRSVHIMEPYWNWGRVAQIIARGVRNDSHIGLPPAEKNVTPYIYLAVPPETERGPMGDMPATTDTELYDESVLNQLVIESFHAALREISIECLVNGENYCKTCNPSDHPLYTDDVSKDVRSPDPCTQLKEEQIRAEEILVDGTKYYYVSDPTSVYEYKVFVFDENINGYRRLGESSADFAKIIEAIESAGKK
jgi:hypothetical protein